MFHAPRILAIATLVAFSSAAFVPCPGDDAEASPAAAHHETAAHAPAEHPGEHAHHMKPKPPVEASQIAFVAPCSCGCDDRDVTRNTAASPRLDVALADTRPTPRDSLPTAHTGDLRLAVPAFAPTLLDPVPI